LTNLEDLASVHPESSVIDDFATIASSFGPAIDEAYDCPLAHFVGYSFLESFIVLKLVDVHIAESGVSSLYIKPVATSFHLQRGLL
jgi:hypothetical protein